MYHNNLLKKNVVCKEIIQEKNILQKKSNNHKYDDGEVFEETEKNSIKITNFMILTKTALDKKKPKFNGKSKFLK